MLDMSRRLLAGIAIAFALAACGGEAEPGQPEVALDPVDLDAFVAQLEASDQPVVVNLWASWCIPCRSEAPLLREAHAAFGDRVRFLGVATEDRPADSARFISEFGLTFENLSDPAGEVKGWFGAFGLPVTVFIRPGGEILRTHFGVIDDQALALGIDDLLASR
jgi:cytochrome c biogenesis protein CcmG, thiol:disulfide interchange protein DsbE